MPSYQALRSLIANDEEEVIVYSADNFPQYPSRQAGVSSKCDRALAAACSNDVVILRGELDKEYHQWLRSLDLGTDHIVEYQQPDTGRILSEVIVENPSPVIELVQRLGRKPVYVPWFSSEQETMATNALDAELFGATEAETLKHNDKAMFKTLCQQLVLLLLTVPHLRYNRMTAPIFKRWSV